MKFFFVIALFFGYLFLSSCTTQKVKEGKIIYSIDYPEIDKQKQSITYMLLPKKQSMTFNQKDVKVKVKKAMFDLNLLASLNRDAFYAELTFDGAKYVDLNASSVTDLLDLTPVYNLEYTDEQDTLLGFTIKKVLVTHPDIGSSEAWYTDEIQLKNPNWYTPYSNLEGVLIKYTINQFGVLMELTASHYEYLRDDSTVFEKSFSGEQIDLLAFQNEMNELFKGVIK